MAETDKTEADQDQKSFKEESDDEPCVAEIPKKPLLSFGINRILGERTLTRSRTPSPSTCMSHGEENDQQCESDTELDVTHSDAEPRSTSSSPRSSPSLSPSKYDAVFSSPAHSIYPLDLASSGLLPLPGCGLYRGSHGIVKVPAQRPHAMLQMFNPYSIPWMDFRRDRFGGNR